MRPRYRQQLYHELLAIETHPGHYAALCDKPPEQFVFFDEKQVKAACDTNCLCSLSEQKNKV